MNLKSPSQLLDFNKKIVLVTGGGSGIGAGISRRFAEAGADVVIADLKSASQVCDYIQGIQRKCLVIQADLTDPDQVNSLFEEISHKWGELDVLINNAGIYPNAQFLKMTAEEWDQTVDIDLKAVFLCTQAAAKMMITAGKGGAIVNISSIESIAPAPGHAHYTAAKAGVVMLSNTAALELGQYQIRVNTVAPGLINRPNLATSWPEGLARYVKKTPLGRVGEPEDIADACLFLASDAARWITGAHLVVDGGVMTSPRF